MRILQCVANPKRMSNPYVYTLMDAIESIDSSIVLGYGWDVFWSNEVFTYDIIHIQWPHMALDYLSSTTNLSKKGQYEKVISRIAEIKSKNIKVVSTCHNIIPHYTNNKYKKEIYNFVYKNSDAILHLGEYSLKLFEKEFANTKNLLLYHHTYDNLYREVPNKGDSLKILGLNPDKKYVLCFGAFRDKRERNLVKYISKVLKSNGVEIIAPSFYTIQKYRSSILRMFTMLKLKAYKFTYPEVHIWGKYIDNDLLPFFYAAADVALIQRTDILNSGNVPMAFLMGKAVVGPDTGNVGMILNKYNNFVFDPKHIETIPSLIQKALLDSVRIGNQNREYTRRVFLSDIIASKLIMYYNQILS